MSSERTLKLKSQFVTKVKTFLSNNFKNASLTNDKAIANIIIPSLTEALSARGEEHGENVLYYALERAISKSKPNKSGKVQIDDDVLAESLAIKSKSKTFVQPSSNNNSKGTGLGRGGPMTNTQFSYTKTRSENRFISDSQIYKSSLNTFINSLKKSHNVQISDNDINRLHEEASTQVFNAGIKHAEVFLTNTIKGAKENANGAISLKENDIAEGLDYADSKYKEYRLKMAAKNVPKD